MVDGKGRLVRAILTAGQASDMKIGPKLVKGVVGVRIVGDKGYDSKARVMGARMGLIRLATSSRRHIILIRNPKRTHERVSDTPHPAAASQ
jgi:hypothetical protein